MDDLAPEAWREWRDREEHEAELAALRDIADAAQAVQGENLRKFGVYGWSKEWEALDEVLEVYNALKRVER